jgi:serine/threonine-protein phosphatase 2A regulatory subunit B''
VIINVFFIQGFLSIEELMSFEGYDRDPIKLTYTAIKRILEENIQYRQMEMDFKCFLDLVIAFRLKDVPEALSYFWKILDVEKNGRLSTYVINYFYGDVYESLTAGGYDASPVENIIVEINDILACNDPLGPTYDDFVRSGKGFIVASMLLDIQGFWNYDNRETLMQQNDELAAQEAAMESNEFNIVDGRGSKTAEEDPLDENYEPDFDDSVDEDGF